MFCPLFIQQLLLLLQLSELCFIVSASDIASAIAKAINAVQIDPPFQSLSTACGQIVNDPDTFIFHASLAYQCLTSVPFNKAVATRFLQYYNDTIQFQSTLAYLKNPPPSYQQPAVDLLTGLNDLQDAVNDDIFKNEYEFEAVLLHLLYAANDLHLSLAAGVLSIFNFASPYDIVSISLDGVQLPKVYLAVDVFDSRDFTTFKPSAVATINEIDAITYLSDFASEQSVGNLEPHADWNQLFYNQVQDIIRTTNTFSGSATFYPGDEIRLTFENGSKISDHYRAIYNYPFPTGRLQTGGDFYNFFVLGLLPASFNDTQTRVPTTAVSSAIPTETAPSLQYLAFPEKPDIAQYDQDILDLIYLSGYFFDSPSISVLSIPTFEIPRLDDFQQNLTSYITKSKERGLKKVVIDLQNNYGGEPLLAYDAFEQFFPNIDPFGGSRMRAHTSGNMMGETITSYVTPLLNDGTSYEAANEWLATTRINAVTGKDYASWAEFYSPHMENDDSFTTTSRYNLTSAEFVEAASQTNGFHVSGYGYGSSSSEFPPYRAEDIIILSNGICYSACALFLEMMHHEAGVRVVVAGGRPTTGAMQSSSSRGARSYNTHSLDRNIDYVQQVLRLRNSPQSNFLPNRTDAQSIWVAYASVNLRDQVRRGESAPLQFAYDAADRRIFYTPQTVRNMTALWQYAADAIWTTPAKCVPGSTGLAVTGVHETNLVGPSNNPQAGTTVKLADLPHSSTTTHHLSLDDPFRDGAPFFGRRASPNEKLTRCSDDSSCPQGSTCHKMASCRGGPEGNFCAFNCQCLGLTDICGPSISCRPLKKTGQKSGVQDIFTGFCPPVLTVQDCGATTPKIAAPIVGPLPPEKKLKRREER